jgi:hypothetical protein
MAAPGNGAPGPHRLGNVAPAAGPAAPAVGNAGVPNAAAAVAAVRPAQPRFDIAAGLQGFSNIGCEIHAQIDEA